MAYEVHLHYNERTSVGEYNRKESKTLKKVIGEITEEVPMETLASFVLSQMARRDIFVYDVEVFELVKKKVPFKETKDGISIKNKKFNLLSEKIIVQDDGPELPKLAAPTVPQQAVPSMPVPEVSKQVFVEGTKPVLDQSIAQQLALAQRNFPQKPKRPIRKVVFMPSKLAGVRINGKFTPEKEYDVYSEKMNESGIGMILSVLDDNGNNSEVQDEFFVPADINLSMDAEIGFTKRNSGGPKLAFEGEVGGDMVQLRKN
jgi:hypothetical protein